MGSLGDDMVSPKSDELGSNKFKFLCSYGGKILPRPGDGHLRYIGGETRVVAVNKNITLQEFTNKLEKLCGESAILKYQLPTEDLDTLVWLTCDEDLQNMKEEYERYESCSSLLRAFLFPAKQVVADSHAENKTLEQRYIDAVNGIPLSKPHTVDPAEIKIDCSATLDRPAQTEYPRHHYLPSAQALREVELNKRHVNINGGSQSKSLSHYVHDVGGQSGLRRVPSDGMMVTCLSPSPPSSPPNLKTDFRVSSNHVDLQRVHSSPNLEHYHCLPASPSATNRHVAVRHCQGGHAIIQRPRGGGGELSRLRYSRSDIQIKKPPQQFLYVDHPVAAAYQMKAAQNRVVGSQESPRNVGNHNKHMIRNTAATTFRDACKLH